MKIFFYCNYALYCVYIITSSCITNTRCENLDSQLFLGILKYNMWENHTEDSYNKDLLHIFDKNYEDYSEIAEDLSEKDVHFWLYTRYSPDDYEILKTGNIETIENSKFNLSKSTKINVHGWLGSGNSLYSRDIKSALLDRYDVNVINIDWPAKSLYSRARLSVNAVAKYLSKFLDFLIDEVGVDKSSIHVLGHSLGAHIAGIAGREMKNAPLPWITGFDPASPLFGDDKLKRLDSSDADFVDVIHTTAGFIGYRQPIGHLDFYPNGGTAIQPGCGFDIGVCSHFRSFYYYIESLSNKMLFLAVPCDSYEDFTNALCCVGSIEMGYNVDKTARGKYYLKTNNRSPFALGNESIVEPCYT